MQALRSLDAKPRCTGRRPAYPQILGAGLAIALAGCGAKAIDGTGSEDGRVAADADTERSEQDGSSEPGEDSVDLAGIPPLPFDAEPDHEDEPDPPLGGGPLPPYDAGADGDEGDGDVEDNPPMGGKPIEPWEG